MGPVAGDENEPVIEGEFIEADPGKTSKTAPESRLRRFMRFLPWLFVLVLGVFIGGLFAAPYVENQLIRFGLIADGKTPDADNRSDHIQRLDDLDITLAALGRRLQTLENAVNAIGDESAANKARLERIEQRPVISPGMTNSTSEDMAAYDTRLLALRERMDALEAAMTAKSARLDVGFSTLGDRLAAAQSDRARLSADIAGLSSRIDGLERPATQTQLTVTPGVFPAILALGRHLEDGTAYQAAMPALHAHFRDNTDVKNALETLDRFAQTGIPALSALKRDFEPMATTIRQAEHASGNAQEGDAQKRGGWFSGLKDSLANIVVIRPTDPALASGLEAELAKAKQALENDDLTQAVRIVENLPPEIRTYAAHWLEKADNRLAVKAAFYTLLEDLQASGRQQVRP